MYISSYCSILDNFKAIGILFGVCMFKVHVYPQGTIKNKTKYKKKKPNKHTHTHPTPQTHTPHAHTRTHTHTHTHTQRPQDPIHTNNCVLSDAIAN